jgi:hypothetical protein
LVQEQEGLKLGNKYLKKTIDYGCWSVLLTHT